MSDRSDVTVHAVKTVYNNTIGPPVLCCYNQVAVVTSSICAETSETVLNMCVVVV